MNYLELNEMWAADSEINRDDVIGETVKIPKLHNKYYLMYVKEGLRTEKLKSDLKELQKAKREYYDGSMDELELKERGWKPYPKKIMRTEIGSFVEADKDVIELSLRIAFHLANTKYLEDIIKTLNNRNFLLRNIIDWSKFQSGG